MNVISGLNIGGPVPGECDSRMLDLSATPRQILASLETGPLASASGSHQRMARHIATPEGQAWVEALRAVETPSRQEATDQVSYALRGLSLTAPDSMPPEISVCASSNPATGKFKSEQKLIMGQADGGDIDSIVLTPRYKSGEQGNVISVHTHPILIEQDSDVRAALGTGLSEDDLKAFSYLKTQIGKDVELTLASVSVLSGHVTSVTGDEFEINVAAPAVLDGETSIGIHTVPTEDFVQRMHDAGRSQGTAVIAPPNSQVKQYLASIVGREQAENTPAAAALKYLENRDRQHPL